MDNQIDDRAVESIADMEKAYGLLFKENGDLKNQRDVLVAALHDVIANAQSDSPEMWARAEAALAAAGAA